MSLLATNVYVVRALSAFFLKENIQFAQCRGLEKVIHSIGCLRTPQFVQKSLEFKYNFDYSHHHLAPDTTYNNNNNNNTKTHSNIYFNQIQRNHILFYISLYFNEFK